jgi:hypothetical protein
MLYASRRCEDGLGLGRHATPAPQHHAVSPLLLACCAVNACMCSLCTQLDLVCWGQLRPMLQAFAPGAQAAHHAPLPLPAPRPNGLDPPRKLTGRRRCYPGCTPWPPLQAPTTAMWNPLCLHSQHIHTHATLCASNSSLPSQFSTAGPTLANHASVQHPNMCCVGIPCCALAHSHRSQARLQMLGSGQGGRGTWSTPERWPAHMWPSVHTPESGPAHQLAIHTTRTQCQCRRSPHQNRQQQKAAAASCHLQCTPHHSTVRQACYHAGMPPLHPLCHTPHHAPLLVPTLCTLVQGALRGAGVGNS